MLITLSLGYLLDTVYVSVTSQAAKSTGPEGSNILVDFRHWIAKFLSFSRTPERHSVPETSEHVEAIELPELGAAGGSMIDTFQILLSRMVGVDMTNVTICFIFIYFRRRANAKDRFWRATRATRRRNTCSVTIILIWSNIYSYYICVATYLLG